MVWQFFLSPQETFPSPSVSEWIAPRACFRNFPGFNVLSELKEVLSGMNLVFFTFIEEKQQEITTIAGKSSVASEAEKRRVEVIADLEKQIAGLRSDHDSDEKHQKDLEEQLESLRAQHGSELKHEKQLEEEIAALRASAAADAEKMKQGVALLEAANKRDQEMQATQAELKEEIAALSALLVAEAEKRKHEAVLLEAANRRDEERVVELEESRKRIAEAEKNLSKSRAAEIKTRDENLELKMRMSEQQRRLDQAQLELQAHKPKLACIPSLVLIPSLEAPLSPFSPSPFSPRLFPLLSSPLKTSRSPPPLLITLCLCGIAELTGTSGTGAGANLRQMQKTGIPIGACHGFFRSVWSP